jgi:hypothetical protein
MQACHCDLKFIHFKVGKLNARMENLVTLCVKMDLEDHFKFVEEKPILE